MNVGVNYLREHIISDARVHYAITNTGGFTPNVVQAEEEVLYLIRAPKTSQVQEIHQRVCNIAKGAALMMEAEVEIVFDKACSNLVPFYQCCYCFNIPVALGSCLSKRMDKSIVH